MARVDAAPARAEIETGRALDTAHQCAVLELLLRDDASSDPGATAGATPADAPGDVLGETVLHWAAREGQVETAEWLLARGATVNVRSSDGLTPLQVADSAEVQDILRRRAASYAASARRHIEVASNRYDTVAALLNPAVAGNAGEHYRDFIGNPDKQIAHAEDVLVPVKAELAAAGDDIEKAVAAMA